jgi:hypothetical protein
MRIQVGEQLIDISGAAELRSLHIEYHDHGTVMALKLTPRDGAIWALLSDGTEIPDGGMPPGVYKRKKRESE